MSEIVRYKGDTYSVEVVLKKNGVPVDLSAGSATAKFSFAKGSKKVTIEGVNGNAAGEVSFPFPAKVAAGNYAYDVQITYSNGEIQTFIKDKLKILDDVTV